MEIKILIIDQKIVAGTNSNAKQRDANKITMSIIALTVVIKILIINLKIVKIMKVY